MSHEAWELPMEVELVPDKNVFFDRNAPMPVSNIYTLSCSKPGLRHWLGLWSLASSPFQPLPFHWLQILCGGERSVGMRSAYGRLQMNVDKEKRTKIFWLMVFWEVGGKEKRWEGIEVALDQKLSAPARRSFDSLPFCGGWVHMFSPCRSGQIPITALQDVLRSCSCSELRLDNFCSCFGKYLVHWQKKAWNCSQISLRFPDWVQFWKMMG